MIVEIVYEIVVEELSVVVRIRLFFIQKRDMLEVEADLVVIYRGFFRSTVL